MKGCFFGETWVNLSKLFAGIRRVVPDVPGFSLHPRQETVVEGLSVVEIYQPGLAIRS
jgi:hypothetical protein